MWSLRSESWFTTFLSSLYVAKDKVCNSLLNGVLCTINRYLSHNPQIITNHSLNIFILYHMVLASVAVVLALISVVGITAQFLAIPMQNPRLRRGTFLTKLMLLHLTLWPQKSYKFFSFHAALVLIPVFCRSLQVFNSNAKWLIIYQNKVTYGTSDALLSRCPELVDCDGHMKNK
jgi:hypothetical protein